MNIHLPKINFSICKSFDNSHIWRVDHSYSMDTNLVVIYKYKYKHIFLYKICKAVEDRKSELLNNTFSTIKIDLWRCKDK